MTSPRARTKKPSPVNGNVHTLPSGSRVVFRKLEHLRARDVKDMVREVSSRIATSDKMVDLVFLMREIVLSRVAFDWELSYPAPEGREWTELSGDASLLDDLQAADYNHLMEVLEPLVSKLLPNMALSGPTSPTTPANG